MQNPQVAYYSGQTQNIDYTPGSAVAAGAVVFFAGLACFAQRDIPANTLGSLVYSGGVWMGNKDASVFAVGDPVYWNATGSANVGTTGAGCFTSTSANNTFVGHAIVASLTGEQFVEFVKSNSAGSQFRTVSGQFTTVTAADTVATGLTTVVAVVASLDSDPTDNPEWVTATIGNQSGAPAAGSIIIKTWQNTTGTDPTPVAATTFSKKVNWIAVGK